ncbi:VPA1262 family N-terminal domain-containing protein [Burkholderia gladioli]|uniref:VPA1262 family N-terminal domain-containing protein n=1 Tax=Burkholderia gladioli TaxID=28095 RepID=UPI003B50E681
MPLALTVFGVVADGLNPTLCYALIRTVRGPGIYPEPNLPRDVAIDGVSRSAVPDTPLELIIWDKIIPTVEEVGFQNAFNEGCLTLPDECPIAAGQTIEGAPVGSLIVEEKNQRARISGVGLLYRKGIATEAPFKALNQALYQHLKPGAASKALEILVSTIGAMSGIGEIFGRDRPIGSIDYFYRAPAIMHLDGPLFDVVLERSDFRTKGPTLRLYVRRHAAPLDQKFSLQVKLGNHDDVLRVVLFDIAGGAPEAIVGAPTHITDVSIAVFDEAGNLVDQLHRQFSQGIQFDLSAIGAMDAFPPPFPGAPKSPDLEARHRVHTISFEGPSIANRSGGLDVLRKNHAKLATLIGPLSPKFENVWFERGAKGQLEVIRWIKKKVEQPGLAKAYLVDPYLGSNALKRVVARQGNESAEFFIIVSPGDIDPDADAAASTASSDYLAKLISTATEWAPKLAGRVSIVHIKRGNGSEQAFHDRYICVIDRKGVPKAYLLSNSLSKAAGDWPFTISELNQVMSWRIYAYILEMVEGHAQGLQPEVIWKSADAPKEPAPSAVTTSASCDTEPAWAVPVKAFLADVWNVIIGNTEFKPQVGARIDALLCAWPEDIDLERFADALFKVVKLRDAIVVFVSDHLRNCGKDELADMLDEKLLNLFLERLPDAGQQVDWFLPFDVRRLVLENLGKTIARKKNATNFVRAKINPKVHGFVRLIETQRFEQAIAWGAHEVGLFLSIIALNVAVLSDAPESHRIGVATDYIHWLGRLMRSDIAAGIYVAHDIALPGFLNDLIFAAKTIAKVRYVLGEDLNVPIDRIKDDPWVASIFREELLSSLL